MIPFLTGCEAVFMAMLGMPKHYPRPLTQPYLAAKNGDLQTLKKYIMVQNYTNNKSTWDNAAIYAAENGQVEALKLLIDAGIDKSVLVNIKPAGGRLIIDLLCKADFEMLDYFYEIGIDFNSAITTDKSYSNFIWMFVSDCGSFADWKDIYDPWIVNLQKNNNDTEVPKTLKEKIKLINYMASKGVDFTVKAKSSANYDQFVSPMTIALTTNQWGLAAFLYDLTQKNLTSDIDYSKYKNYKITEFDRHRLIEFCRQEDSEIESSMLYIAYYRRDFKDVKAIVDLVSPERRAEVINQFISRNSLDIRDKLDDRTQWENSIIYLMDNGASINKKDIKGESFLTIAIKQKNDLLVKKLLARGAESEVNSF